MLERTATGLVATGLLLASLPADAERVTLDFEIAGLQRSVLVFAPRPTENRKLPLVIVFHGRGDDSGNFARAVRLHKDWPEAIVAYPRGLPAESVPRMRGWQYRAGTEGDRDLALTDALLETLRELYPIDPRQQYVAGFSNGGHFVMLLMRERASDFASFAVIGALQPDFESAAPPRPLIFLFGRYENADMREDWVKTVEALSRHQRAGGKPVEYEDCCTLLPAKPDGAPMVFGLYNAGHVWPRQGNDWLTDFWARFGQASDGGDSAGD